MNLGPEEEDFFDKNWKIKFKFFCKIGRQLLSFAVKLKCFTNFTVNVTEMPESRSKYPF